jgi:MYXO-CTERM domain-containing protein
MKRLSLIGSWKRLGVQLGLLGGIGLAFVGGSEPPKVEAAPQNCTEEGQCTIKKPLFLIILDYSTSMNLDFDGNVTRWEGAVNAINSAIDADNGFLASNFILGLERFGHDPNPNTAGTTIPNDNSGIVDGQSLDVPFYDENDPNKAYFECTQGDAIKAKLEELAAGPLNGNNVGIGTWTKGALDFASAYFTQTYDDHPEDVGNRLASIMVVTDGAWTNPQGNMPLAPANQNPAITATALFNGDPSIATYVVALGDAEGLMFADQLAMAGGTGTAIDAGDPQALIDALQAVIDELKMTQIVPVCTPGLPRIMVLLDASSSMLNINGGMDHAPAGMGGWDQAREALAGANSLFDQPINNDPNKKVENLVHLGLSVFGHNQPAEEKLIVQYGPCRKDNFGWALDPNTSCENPGCNDPYGPPPITWTFKDGSIEDPPNFDDQTLSHMPKCNKTANPPNACVGSGTYTHLGLELIQDNIDTYKGICSQMDAPQPCNDDTEFINILITDGQYTNFSTDAQVQAPLQAMFNDGITTYVIGFGDGVNTPAAITQLNKMADWGSGNQLDYFDANNQDALEAALASIIEQITFDPCCEFNDCDFVPEPTTEEPDPEVPPDTESGTTTDAQTDTDTDTGTTDPITATETDATTDPSASNTDTDPSASNTDTDPSASNTDTDPSATNTDPSATNTDTNASDTDPPTTGEPTTTNPTQTSNPTTNDTNDESSGDADTDTSTTVDTAGVDDEGCGCKVEDGQGQTRGILGTLLTFGLAGFIRRRRRG